MKYFSEILNQTFDTAEACEAAEKKSQEEQAAKETESSVIEVKENKVSVDRKDAAQKVEKAFAEASKMRKDNAAKRDELKEKAAEINRKYDEQIAQLESERKKEYNEVLAQYRMLDKEDRQNLEVAYDELRKFCKKYGTYHYSVNAEGADLFPMLFGFGRMEKMNDVFNGLFDNFFNLF